MNAKDFKFNPRLRLLIIVQPLGKSIGTSVTLKKIGDGNNSIATIKSTSFLWYNQLHESCQRISSVLFFSCNALCSLAKTLVCYPSLHLLF
jgi:hypothetical protein